MTSLCLTSTATHLYFLIPDLLFITKLKFTSARGPLHLRPRNCFLKQLHSLFPGAWWWWSCPNAQGFCIAPWLSRSWVCLVRAAPMDTGVHHGHKATRYRPALYSILLDSILGRLAPGDEGRGRGEGGRGGAGRKHLDSPLLIIPERAGIPDFAEGFGQRVKPRI